LLAPAHRRQRLGDLALIVGVDQCEKTLLVGNGTRRVAAKKPEHLRRPPDFSAGDFPAPTAHMSDGFGAGQRLVKNLQILVALLAFDGNARQRGSRIDVTAGNVADLGLRLRPVNGEGAENLVIR